uniref:NADH-ubiquinone oxidoreductase chain 1 n=1 Tax=Selaroides leptolepis TaxID=173311 RepID=A0A109WX56_SELLE|nr:NADH dehydrogenase subunit 1 [Selaroides leptolepis]
MITAVITHLLTTLAFIVPVLLAVAWLTLIERKVLGYMQLLKGPNAVGPYALLLPMADGVNLLIKEPVRRSTSSPMLFLVAPMLALTLAVTLWAPMRLPYPVADLNLGILFMLALSSLAVYSIMRSGWASNSKYAVVGALRAVAQTISHDVSLGLILLNISIFTGGNTLHTFNTAQESIWLVLRAWPLAAMWYITTLAETNRAPYELTEGESELVSVFNVEYAGGPFALFFLAEYANILSMKTLSATLLVGASHIPTVPALSAITLITKAALLAMVFLWVRASYPRFRYDQLMHVLWKNLLRLSLALVIWHLALPIAFAGLRPQL